MIYKDPVTLWALRFQGQSYKSLTRSGSEYSLEMSPTSKRQGERVCGWGVLRVQQPAGVEKPRTGQHSPSGER